MKRYQVIIPVVLICLMIVPLSGHSQEADQAQHFLTDDPDTTMSGWFTVKKVAENVLCIDDHGAANIYLVMGSDSALVIDTGIGAADLRAFVKSLTDLPLIVVNTHGHPDHSGANYQFDEPVYAHPRDFEAVRSYDSPERRRGSGAMMMGGAEVPEDEIFTDTLNLEPVVLKPVTEGYVFDLGGRELEVIEIPGHTQGEICLLDSENKILFTGDHNNMMVWLHLQGCTPLETYLGSLEKQRKRINEFDTMMPGHGPPVESGFIEDQISCVHSILDGSCEAKPFESFAGNGLICTYGRASVVYNPDNLYITD